MPQLKFIVFITLCLLFSPLAEAKKRCKPLLAKLQNIQALQRQGHSAKGSLSLRSREDKARNNWWQCENSSGKNKKKSKQLTTKKIKKKSNSKTAKYKKIKAGTPFKTTNAIVIKSKYQGNKKRAWLAFYQQPTRCQRPKNLSIFAFCSENKRIQRAKFEQQYSRISYAQ